MLIGSPRSGRAGCHLSCDSMDDASPKSSSPRRSTHRPRDEESGAAAGEEIDCDDTFVIPPKNAPVERLRRWRQAALVLNASRRFRYTLDLKKEEEKEEVRRKIRAHAQVIRAALLFKEAGEREKPGIPGVLEHEELTKMTRDRDFFALQRHGGVNGIASLLKTDLDKGISGDEAEIVHRRNSFGSNTYPRKKGRSFLVFLWEAWQDLTLIILMIAAAVSLALGIKTEGIDQGWYDGGSIFFAVFIVIVVTAFSDYRQSLQFQNLNEEKRNIHLEVIRGGRRIKVSIFDLVVGDVVPLKIGDLVPADGIVITAHSLAMDESSMTGESKVVGSFSFSIFFLSFFASVLMFIKSKKKNSYKVHKDQKAPFLMAGCKVADGYGNMLVTAVGMNTEWGILMASISEDNGEETPLQVRLNGLATFIGIVGLTVAGIVLRYNNYFRYFTGNTKDPDGTVQFVKGQTSTKAAVNGAIKLFTVAVTIVVVAVPEGLPLAVTLTLAYSMRKMMTDKALVRRLSACETMGSATTICSDKTGTLTLNEMTIVEAYIGKKKIDPPDNAELFSASVLSRLIDGISQNTRGSVFHPKASSSLSHTLFFLSRLHADGMLSIWIGIGFDGVIELSGSPTEKAILSWGVKLGMNFDDARSKSSIIHVFPFNSEKKRAGVAIQLSDSEVHVHWKGAAEINEFYKCIEDMAAVSLRCMAFAYRPLDLKEIPNEEHRGDWSLPEDHLILLAIVGMKDPCRSGVREAVALCTRAGVKVRMVTGDNLRTAKAIALECGILKDVDAPEPILIEGKTFRTKSNAEQDEISEKITVMGRSSPNDKLLLVQALRRRGHVVAVTGDGTNDAPALHEADIGLAMGIQGTEVAKESSDIIILDDDFASVVKVVRWGRSVYANIQKFIQFQLTVNVAALVINVVAAFSSGEVPLNTVQLLWVNLIMDTLGALALATEPPTDHLMDRTPVGRREPLITNIMWRNLMVQAFYQITVLLVLNFAGKSILHLRHETREHADKAKNTFIFNTFVLCQIFNEFNARKVDELNVFSGVLKNHLFIGIVGLTTILQVMIVEFLGQFTKTVRLNWKLWLVSIAIAIISWPLAVLGKLIPVPSTPFAEYFRRCSFWRKKQDDGAAQESSNAPS
ncbi:hypothetical protein ZIOFF_034583 [Zingiber officinale]|uniref:Calcium-transporting ATPase n=1 Tax=Zingiber officinale TaxID=94328 RepID=A0A8J5GPV4_ZINOF|nr:hypothetical protein ZIOFF_034583 [Zingiber officinale]